VSQRADSATTTMPSKRTPETLERHLSSSVASAEPPGIASKLFLWLAPFALMGLWFLAFVSWTSPTSGADNFLNDKLDLGPWVWLEIMLDASPWVAWVVLGRGRWPARAVALSYALACAYWVGSYFIYELFAQELNALNHRPWSNPWDQVHAFVAVGVLVRSTQLAWRHRERCAGRPRDSTQFLAAAPVVLMTLFAGVQVSWRFCTPAYLLRLPSVDVGWCVIDVDGSYWLTMLSTVWVWAGLRALGNGPTAALRMAAGSALLGGVQLWHLVLGPIAISDGVCVAPSVLLDVSVIGALGAGTVVVWRQRAPAA